MHKIKKVHIAADLFSELSFSELNSIEHTEFVEYYL